MPLDLASYLTPDKDQSHLQFQPQFSGGLAQFLAAAPGGGVSIYSGYRSPERQAQLYDEALAKYGSPEAARKWVAPPGKSQHNHGNAADLRFADDAARKWAHDNAPNYGLSFPLGNEPWHVEFGGARGGPAPAAPQVAPQVGPTIENAANLPAPAPEQRKGMGLGAVIAGMAPGPQAQPQQPQAPALMNTQPTIDLAGLLQRLNIGAPDAAATRTF